ncbi:MAG: alpha-D-ribose 1-methylphosphonate 5-triphosphate diphosphatase [Caldilineaceae bacterium]
MWLSDLQIVLPDQVLTNGAICIDGCRIVEIRNKPVRNADVHAPGLTALPGLIDLHGDMLEREISPRPKAAIPIDLALHELDKRLVATGITTAYAAVSFAWHRSDSIRSEERAREIMEMVNRLRPHLLADHFVHARFEITNPSAGLVLKELLDDGQVHLVSIMDHTPGQGQYRDIEAYIKFAVEWSKRTGEAYGKSEDEVRAQVAERQSWPKGWDVVREVAQVAQTYGVPLASHDDDTIAKVDWVHEIGVNISEFPVTEEAAAEARRRGLHVAMGAPNALQGRSLSGNLSAADAVAAGLVDTLATDYYPASMLHAMHAFVERGMLPLHEASKLVSENPADALGLSDRGRLSIGNKADIVLADLRQRPRVHGVIRNGEPIYWDLYMARCGTLPVSQHLLEAVYS